MSASREAGRITFIFWFVEWISIVIFSIVVAVLGYAVWKFRVREGVLSDGPPLHGHTGLEIAWTAIPFLLVTSIAVVSAIVLSKNAQAGKDPVRITVTGQQFAWTFTYANKQTHPFLRLPLYKQVLLTIESKDVLHSFWIPQMFQKQDAVPGLPTHLVITPTKLGVFPVICVELCGLGHSVMRSQAIVMTQAAYAKWYKGTAAAAATGGGAGSGLATFTSNGCNACHTFTAAKATGKIGPDLDNLKQYAAKAKQPLGVFIKEAIIHPPAPYVPPGFPTNVMPTTFKQSIPPPQLDALVKYLANNAK